ncbi:MAG TPA: hypothetical protein VMV25_09385 [Steroidobacteraceae bacterium]|nr:hypothetical protein [Steroidobacteraceae bacterium]
MSEQTVQVGLLYESVQAQQKSIADSLAHLQAHAQDLDEIVRDEIRRTLIDELKFVAAESDRAVKALQGLKRAASVRTALLGIAMAAATAAASGAAVRLTLPSARQIDVMRGERAALALDIGRLAAQGARVEWGRCGDARRLCVRVRRQGPAYGKNADYLIAMGY